MALTIEQAIKSIPASAPNRESLAGLLLATQQVVADIERDAVQSKWHARMFEIAKLLNSMDSMPTISQKSKARKHLARAVDAARKYAACHRLKPDTRSGVLADARLIAGTL